MRRQYLLGAVGLVVALVLVAGWLYRRGTSEHRIRSGLTALARLAEKTDGENPLHSAQVMRHLGNAFTEDARVRVPAYQLDLRGRRPIAETMAQIRMMHHALDLALRDVSVVIDPTDRRQAAATLTVLARGRLADGHSYTDAHEFRLALRLDDGQWRVDEVERVTGFE